MKGIKKGILTVVIVIVLLMTIAAIQVSLAHSGKTYYTQIIHEGTATGVVMDQYSVEYEYKEPGFDKDGDQIELDFYSYKEKAIKNGAYLSVVYNKDNGVISYEEIQKKDIPEKAAEALNNYAD